ncbi:hypothetical protein LGQ02_16640 [Bacillus shivajii]|uniref:YVTN family beta-propeller repeat protein n=1 Tax=Bacillus shivajii TaxID=1983719 RepID=UPI001CFAE4AD|nr:hypothetical protein [Bacillus shivajii]UCZ52449.1 hypothetical protein LGQ02_16640 [Bacillus shivajii]
MLKSIFTFGLMTMILLMTACALESGENGGGDQTDVSDAGDLTSVQFYVPSEEDNLISVIDVVSGEHVADIDTGMAPTIVTFASTMRQAFVANQDSSTVEIVNTQSLEVESEIEVGPRPHGLALSSNNQTLYVATVGDQYIDVVNVGEQEVVDQYDLGTGAKTNYVYLEDGTLFVTDHENHAVYALDAESGEVLDTFETGGTPRVVRAYENKLYVATSEGGTLEEINLESGAVNVIDVGHGATDVVITEGGNQAVVTSVEESFVALVDLEAGEVVERIENQEGAKHLSFNREQSRVYVTLSGSNEVSVIDMEAFEEEYRIEIGGNMPHGIELKALPGIGGSC